MGFIGRSLQPLRCIGSVALQHVESSQTRDQTCVPLHWQADSYPLHHQRSAAPTSVGEGLLYGNSTPLGSVGFGYTASAPLLLSRGFFSMSLDVEYLFQVDFNLFHQ